MWWWDPNADDWSLNRTGVLIFHLWGREEAGHDRRMTELGNTLMGEKVLLFQNVLTNKKWSKVKLESILGIRFSELEFHGYAYFKPADLCFMIESVNWTFVSGRLWQPIKDFFFPGCLWFSISQSRRVLGRIMRLEAALITGAVAQQIKAGLWIPTAQGTESSGF